MVELGGDAGFGEEAFAVFDGGVGAHEFDGAFDPELFVPYLVHNRHAAFAEHAADDAAADCNGAGTIGKNHHALLRGNLGRFWGDRIIGHVVKVCRNIVELRHGIPLDNR